MKSRLTLQQRLILPIVLLGLITLLSNILAVFGIHNVNANAGIIVDRHMVSEAQLEDIRRSMMEIHRLALSHIVAADHARKKKLRWTKNWPPTLLLSLQKTIRPIACFWKIMIRLSMRSFFWSVPAQTVKHRKHMRWPMAMWQALAAPQKNRSIFFTLPSASRQVPHETGFPWSILSLC